MLCLRALFALYGLCVPCAQGLMLVAREFGWLALACVRPVRLGSWVLLAS
ncbi:MAG: hypothetical protein HC858_07655 [Brachymonas sp.]|nr:hypothetical protein [Brachymonas sp.]